MCASCENYLGELNNKTEYIAWNKYPGGHNGKQSNDGANADGYGNFRAGSGFSRILSMVNLSNKEGIDSKEGKNSETHGGNSVNNRNTSDKILPKLNENSSFEESMVSRMKRTTMPISPSNYSNFVDDFTSNEIYSANTLNVNYMSPNKHEPKM